MDVTGNELLSVEGLPVVDQVSVRAMDSRRKKWAGHM